MKRLMFNKISIFAADNYSKFYVMVTIEKETMTRVISQVDVLQKIQQVIEKQTVFADKQPVFVSVDFVVGARKLNPQKGFQLAQHLIPLLKQNRRVQVSLKGVLILNPGFLQALYTQLFLHLKPDIVENQLTFIDLKGANHITIKNAKADAYLYVFDREKYDRWKANTLDFLLSNGYISEEAAVCNDGREDF